MRISFVENIAVPALALTAQRNHVRAGSIRVADVAFVRAMLIDLSTRTVTTAAGAVRGHLAILLGLLVAQARMGSPEVSEASVRRALGVTPENLRGSIGRLLDRASELGHPVEYENRVAGPWRLKRRQSSIHIGHAGWETRWRRRPYRSSPSHCVSTKESDARPVPLTDQP